MTENNRNRKEIETIRFLKNRFNECLEVKMANLMERRLWFIVKFIIRNHSIGALSPGSASLGFCRSPYKYLKIHAATCFLPLHFGDPSSELWSSVTSCAKCFRGVPFLSVLNSPQPKAGGVHCARWSCFRLSLWLTLLSSVCFCDR